MIILQADQRDLLLPLLAGIGEVPPWQTFMTSLVARTQTRLAFLVTQPTNAPKGQAPIVQRFVAPQTNADEGLEFGQLTSLGLRGLERLRPGRVYSLDEMLDFDDQKRLEWQRTYLERFGVSHARWLRVSADVADAWFVLTRDREDFSASTMALVSSLAPHFAAALRAQVKLSEEQQRADLAQHCLARLGIGQLGLDRSGRVLVADKQAETMLTIIEEGSSGRGRRRLALSPEVMRNFEEACADVSDGPEGGIATVVLDGVDETFLLLRKPDVSESQSIATLQVIGIVRAPMKLSERPAKAAMASLYGLSEREAALACGIANGGKITEVGADLRLTRETSRNYSKRIYEKTGTSSQADLVRKLLGGLPPLA